MDAETSEKLLPKKSIKNTVLSARLRAKKSIKMSQNFIKNHWLKHGTFLNFLNEKDYYLILFQAPDLEKFRKRWREKRPYLTNFQAPKFERDIAKFSSLIGHLDTVCRACWYKIESYNTELLTWNIFLADGFSVVRG